MARRKKFNKKVAVFLGILGAVIVVGGIIFGLNQLPKDANALLLQAREARQAGEWDEAEILYAKAIKEAENADRDVYPRHEYYLEAAKFYDERSREQENLSELKKGKQIRNALGLARTATRSEPDHLEAREFLCELMWRYDRRNYVEDAARLLELDADRAETWYRMGLVKAGRGIDEANLSLIEEGIAALKKAIELDPDEIDYQVKLSSVYASRERFEDAENSFKKSIAQHPESVEAHLAYARYLSYRDKDEEALEFYKKAVELETEGTEAHRSLARHYAQNDQIDKAVQLLTKALEIDPAAHQVYQELSVYLHGQKQLDKAIETVRSGVQAVEKKLTAGGLETGERILLKRGRQSLYRILANLLVSKAEKDEEGRAENLAEAKTILESLTDVKPELLAKVEGRIAYIEGDLKTAAEKLEKVYQSNEQFDRYTAQLLMDVYMKRGQTGEAKAVLDRYLNLSGMQNNPQAFLMKAQLEMQHGNPEEALEALRRVLRLDPDNQRAQEMMVALRALTNDTAAVPTDVELTPATIRILLSKASRYARDGQKQAALKLLRDLHREVPQNDIVTLKLAEFHVNEGERDTALQIVENALDGNPDSDVLKRYHTLVKEPDKEKRYEIAMEMAEEAESKLEVLMRKAAASRVHGKMDEYRKFLAKAAEEDPSSRSVIRAQFSRALQDKDWDAAADAVKRAALENVDQANGRLLEGQMLFAKGEYEKAIPVLKQALVDRPGAVAGKTLLGECYMRTENYEEAYETFRSAVKTNPGFTAAVLGLVRVTDKLGKVAEFSKWVKRAHELAPNSEFVQKHYLDVHEQESDNPLEIIARREQFLQKNPNDLKNRYNLAVLYEKVGRPRDAERQYRYVFANSAQKIAAARPLISFLTRTGENTEVDRIISDLLKTTDDKVAVYILYGDFLKTISARQAETAYQSALKEDPKDPRALYAMAALMQATNRHQAALEYMERYVTASGSDPEDRKQLVRYLIQADELDRAGRELDSILSKNPADVQALTLKGMLRFREGKFDSAQRLLERVTRMAPDYPEPYRYLAQNVRNQGELSKAIEYHRKLYELTGRAQDGLVLAAAYRQARRTTEARRVLQDVVEKTPGHRPAIRQLVSLYRADKKWNELQPFLKSVRNRFPRDPEFILQEADMWKERGQDTRYLAVLETGRSSLPDSPRLQVAYISALLETDRDQEALEEVRKAGTSEKAKPVLNALGARALVNLGKPNEADKALSYAVSKADASDMGFVFSQAVKAHGEEAYPKLRQWVNSLRKDVDVFLILAQFHLNNGKPNEAVKLLKTALNNAENDRQKRDALRSLAMAYYSQGQLDQAEKLYRDVLKENANDPVTLNNLAYLLVNDRDKAGEASNLAEQAVKLSPGNPNVLDTYALALIHLGKYDQAEDVLERTMQLAEPSAVIRYHLAMLYEKTQRYSSARVEYQRAIEAARESGDKELESKIDKRLENMGQKLREG
ncbi:MAG: tetratricopeptide repeat protein [Phycisphaerae bacterium]